MTTHGDGSRSAARDASFQYILTGSQPLIIRGGWVLRYGEYLSTAGLAVPYKGIGCKCPYFPVSAFRRPSGIMQQSYLWLGKCSTHQPVNILWWRPPGP